jgi:hypothetical protein
MGGGLFVIPFVGKVVGLAKIGMLEYYWDKMGRKWTKVVDEWELAIMK